MTDFVDLIECPNCGGVNTTEALFGFVYCLDCGEMWDADDDLPPENDPDAYEETLL